MKTIVAMLAPALLVVTGCDSPPPSPVGDASAPTTALAPTANAPGAVPSPITAVPAEAPTRVGAAQILVTYKGATGAPPTVTRSREEAKKRAEEALQKILDQKENFEQLVATYSDDPVSRASGGAIGNFERNVMPQAFSDAAFALPVGGISGLIETPRGFYIIRRLR